MDARKAILSNAIFRAFKKRSRYDPTTENILRHLETLRDHEPKEWDRILDSILASIDYPGRRRP